jgi:hypothetical protein
LAEIFANYFNGTLLGSFGMKIVEGGHFLWV